MRDYGYVSRKHHGNKKKLFFCVIFYEEKRVEDGLWIPRKNTLQNGYSSNINAHNVKWSNI